ncbi:hypothetical protein [Muricoccus vinaceus]|uniref:Uncharacterized protein n=1 Tax=Muricoccus vinaceus TaxID=424704 RepID=A0ABV6IWQ8_9PROT
MDISSEGGHNLRKLMEKILALSEARDWEVARKEWKLTDIYEADEPQVCLCGHAPIIEICCIHNVITKKNTEVGNRCVKRFFGFRSDLIFEGIKRVRLDNTKSLNADALAFLKEVGLINSWEYGFSVDNLKKRILSGKQLATRRKINDRVAMAMKRRGLSG